MTITTQSTPRLVGRGSRSDERRGTPAAACVGQRSVDLLGRRWSNDGSEFLEEPVGQLLGRRLERRPVPACRPLPLRPRISSASFAVVGESHGRAAPDGKAIAIGRVEIRQCDLARKRTGNLELVIMPAKQEIVAEVKVLFPTVTGDYVRESSAQASPTLSALMPRRKLPSPQSPTLPSGMEKKGTSIAHNH
jgi:hypothetical protein